MLGSRTHCSRPLTRTGALRPPANFHHRPARPDATRAVPRRDGRLNANELAGGLSVLAGGLNRDDKLNLMFDIYDRDRSGSISRTEMSEFMESMCSVAQQYANEQVKDFSSLLGGDTPHARRAGMGSGSETLSDMQRQLRTKLQNHTQMVIERAFGEGRSRGGQLSKSEFTSWARGQPKMFKWLTDLGKKWTTHMAKKNSAPGDSRIRRQLRNITLEEVRQMVTQVVRGSRMTENDIREVLGKLNLRNQQLKQRILSAFDRDRRGEIMKHEFCSCLGMLCSQGNARQKLEFAFRMFGEETPGGSTSLSKQDVESFVNGFFKMARSEMRKMIRSINEMFPGARPDDDASFGRTIQQLTDSRVRQFINKTVDDAMRYATGGRSLDRRGFEQWCGQGDGMSRYLEEIGLRWIDSIEEDFEENLEDSTPFEQQSEWGSDRLSNSFDQSYSEDMRSSPSRESQASKFFDGGARREEDRSRSSYQDSRDRPLDTQRSREEADFLSRAGIDSRDTRDTRDSRGGVGAGRQPGRAWNFSRDDYPRRYQRSVQTRKQAKRPQAQWHKNDHLRFLKTWDMRKIAEVFMKEARGGAMTYQMFCTGMQRLGVKNEAIARGLFDAFDIDKDGTLALEEFTSGIQVLTTGNYREKVRLAFEVFDRRRTGKISRADLKKYLTSFYRVVRETITRVTRSVSDVFGVTSTDSQVLGVTSDQRQNFGREFAGNMDRHLNRSIERMVDDAFRHARDGYEGGGNLSLPDFERWASEQPSLIAWYEHLGDHWLSSIHAQSRSPVQNYRSQRQLSLRRAFQEMKIEDLVRDAQRRSGSWHDMDKRDFEDILRQFFRSPSMGVVDKLFSAYDIDQRGRIDGREALAGLCALAVGSQGHSERRHLRTVFDMFDKDRSGQIDRAELQQCLRAFFMLAYDVVHQSLLNCSELFGHAEDFVGACYDSIDKQTEQVIERVVDTIVRNADSGRDGRISWEEFERWESRDKSLGSWMGKVADLWCEAIAADDSLFPALEEDNRRPDRYPEEGSSKPYPNQEYDDYYDHYDNVQRGYGKKKKNKYRPPYFLRHAPDPPSFHLVDCLANEAVYVAVGRWLLYLVGSGPWATRTSPT